MVSNGIPVTPARDADVFAPPDYRPVDRRVVLVAGLSVGVGVLAAFVAALLTRLIALLTNVAYYGAFSVTLRRPTTEHLGVWSVLVPVIGALIIGLMARFGAEAIRGHG